MSTDYSRSVLRMVVAQICQTIGWHSINSTPLEFMVDLMEEYMLRISKVTHQYAEVLGRTEPNLDDLGLAFKHMNIDIQELAEYAKNVDSVPCAINVPKFPVKRENHLNFLKPGSREVVTRPVHIHEHLPAMYPDTEEEYITDKPESLTNGVQDVSSSNGTSTPSSVDVSPHRMSPQVVFKRPGDPVSFESPIVKRAKVLEEGRPLREIHSVMMTTSGFLSPAREGKLPEARTPHQTCADSPQPSSYPMVPPELKCDKKPKKIIKKIPDDRKLDKENKKKNKAKELFKPDKIDDTKIKKLAGMKELAKLKPLKPGGGKSQTNLAGPSSRPPTPKLIPTKSTGSPKLPKPIQVKAKPEKVIDLTSSPPLPERKDDNIDKLPSEPDKQKLNIFKKISKSREDKEKEIPEQHKHKELDSRESSPGLIIDENLEKHAHKNDSEVKKEEKKTPHTPDVHVHPEGDLIDIQSPSSDVYMFDDMSPPGTPSTPKTPELNVPTSIDQKKKKKEKSNKKKESKIRSPKRCVSPKKTKISNDTVEVDVMDRPKTPQAPEPPVHREPTLPPTLPFPFFPAFPSAPGLIPHPITHPIFPRFPLPLGRGGPGPHPAMPNLPLPPRFLNPAIKPEDFSLSKIKPMECEKSPRELIPPIVPIMKYDTIEKEKADKIKVVKQDKEIITHIPGNIIAPPIVSAPVAPIVPIAPVPVVPLLPSKKSKIDKADKVDKVTIILKSKEHKKEKKEKLKKKKDKKEKHKEKGEKVKEKKDKADKKEKVEKIKEKKEKKEKRKEKEKEDKNAEAVPKITLKLGPASPRPPTPDSMLMKKITIKPLLKKPDEDTKREPSPELAKISALVTRPPKQKSASKKIEEGTLDGSPALPTDSSFSLNFATVPLATVPRAKKSLFKNLPQRESTPPPHFDPTPKLPSPLITQQQSPPFYYDQGGRQVWICPGCKQQDDGSPMIGCDDCDAWYHWVCVGLQVEPAANENWYCRSCITKKQELYHDKKKKKRKKKVKTAA
ncbi:PREDICTED: transcription initiation factor TFIID subunit 3 isoform X1 [Polistes canadensis]|uniref:transcription initiation factor TFIID subunit 3 isoform X1 n=1 Tax=Polistes canadensis TaxID=91411 RepID=UPI000718ADC1|nr:PREDICTED: transcription initiation factor TFIID subunit 3 isoform X1 [Polistes canadensis]XP_014613901.1 PREDICTED: transcription initiation factor TFIID subunit 3 isoform X1 [Polistes canadensis]